ncbi:MAG: hypothetical protein GC185_09935 [Alphaproteobacteria bacterium]|nr:hypothetical protein [Alphaproteobacteria bacterium]
MTEQTPAQPKQPIEPSLFYMWRCVTAIAHADGLIQPEERAYLEKVFASLDRLYDLSGDEKAILYGDLDQAQDVGELLKHVTKPENKALLAHFSRIVAWADGELDMQEEALLDKLNKLLGKNAQNPEFQKEIHDAMAQADAETKKELDDADEKLREKGYLFRAIDGLLLKLGIDMLD